MTHTRDLKSTISTRYVMRGVSSISQGAFECVAFDRIHIFTRSGEAALAQQTRSPDLVNSIERDTLLLCENRKRLCRVL